MKKRLIDVKKVINSMQKCLDECSPDEKDSVAYFAFAAIITALKQEPTVDSVEVVRCKDCKHWHEETGWCYYHSHFIDEDGLACHPWESNNWKMLDADDFCSYGERKYNERKID